MPGVEWHQRVQARQIGTSPEVWRWRITRVSGSSRRVLEGEIHLDADGRPVDAAGVHITAKAAVAFARRRGDSEFDETTPAGDLEPARTEPVRVIRRGTKEWDRGFSLGTLGQRAEARRQRDT